MSDELKPCRGCGGKCSVQEFSGGNIDGVTTLYVCENDPMFGGECFDGTAYTSADCWNRRTTPATDDDVERAFREAKLCDGDHASTCFEAGYRAALASLHHNKETP